MLGEARNLNKSSCEGDSGMDDAKKTLDVTTKKGRARRHAQCGSQVNPGW